MSTGCCATMCNGGSGRSAIWGSPSMRSASRGIWRISTRFSSRYPEMKVVIDHCMKPQIAEQSEDHFRLWADGMARLADRAGTVCKYSALVTEDIEAWTVDRLRPYSDHVLSVFGPDRLMWGSDWPVCRLRTEYSGWRLAADSVDRPSGNSCQGADLWRDGGRLLRAGPLAACHPMNRRTSSAPIPARCATGRETASAAAA